MIPKVIHYCWFGRNSLPDEYKVYMESWKKFCPDYEIKEWNEDNFDVNVNQYCKEAYDAKQWAFVSDYARLKIIYEQGGIYLDTDVELLKSLSPLVSAGVGFLGFQNPEEVNTGLGFAALPYNNCVKSMLDIYEKRTFLKKDGSFDLTPCPVVNTVGLKMHGLKTGKEAIKEIQHLDGIDVYPIDFFNPMNVDTLKISITNNSYSVHRYAASWYSNKGKKRRKIKKIIPSYILNYRSCLISRRDIKIIEKNLK